MGVPRANRGRGKRETPAGRCRGKPVLILAAKMRGKQRLVGMTVRSPYTMELYETRGGGSEGRGRAARAMARKSDWQKPRQGAKQACEGGQGYRCLHRDDRCGWAGSAKEEA